MGGNEHLTVGEFERGIRRLESRFDARFDRLDEKQDDLRDRVVVLEGIDRTANRMDAKRLAGWTTAIATLVAGVIEGARRVFGS